MKPGVRSAIEIVREAKKETRLDLVVDFTTPALTVMALEAAHRLGHELDARVRLVKVQVVPYALDLTEPPVLIDFLKRQMTQACQDQAATGGLVECEIRMAREFLPGLCDAIGKDSVLILATRKRPWRTRAERLVGRLQKAGRTVILIECPHKSAGSFVTLLSSICREAVANT